MEARFEQPRNDIESLFATPVAESLIKRRGRFVTSFEDFSFVVPAAVVTIALFEGEELHKNRGYVEIVYARRNNHYYARATNLYIDDEKASCASRGTDGKIVCDNEEAALWEEPLQAVMKLLRED